MKFLILFVAVVALVSAEEKKPEEEKPRPEEKTGLIWPMPDPSSPGDLMLHGLLAYDRVRQLFKHKLEDNFDKMIMAHGRLYLRQVSKFLDENEDFKVNPILCSDSRKLNATNARWRIKIYDAEHVSLISNEKLEKFDNSSSFNESDTGNATDKPIEKTTEKPSEKSTDRSSERPLATTREPLSSSSVHPSSSSIKPSSSSIEPSSSSSVRPSSSVEPLSSSSVRPSSSSSVRPSPSSIELPSSSAAWSTIEAVSSSTIRPTTVRPAIVFVQVFTGNDQEKDSYEVHRTAYYRLAGSNFARLLMKEYRNETLVKEEDEYLERWVGEEAVHYGALAIYCNEGENVKEIKKQLAVYLEDKPQSAKFRY